MYYRTIKYGGVAHVRVSSGVEYQNGELGICDPRYVNEYGVHRRIIGEKAEQILKLAKNKWIQGIPGYGYAIDYNAYEVPLKCIESIDPQTENTI